MFCTPYLTRSSGWPLCCAGASAGGEKLPRGCRNHNLFIIRPALQHLFVDRAAAAGIWWMSYGQPVPCAGHTVIEGLLIPITKQI